MTSASALAGLRIGCVKYLNAKPLIHSYDGPVQFEHPSELARGIAAGELDAALVPVFELFQHPGYVLVDGVSIASDGPVFSVFLAYRGALADVRRIALDPASLTSVHLVQVLLREFHGIAPECFDSREDSAETDAQLLIGNQAIEFREAHGDEYGLLDLGEEWRRCTGLPFVYAVWLLRPDLPNLSSIAAEFRRLKAAGLERIEEIVSGDTGFSTELARQYLTHHIRFDLGEREKEGLLRFGQLLSKHQFIGSEPVSVGRFV